MVADGRVADEAEQLTLTVTRVLVRDGDHAVHFVLDPWELIGVAEHVRACEAADGALHILVRMEFLRERDRGTL